MPAWLQLLLLRAGICVGVFLAGFGSGWMKFEKAAEIAALKSKVTQLQTNVAILEADSSQAVVDAGKLAQYDKNAKEQRDAITPKKRTTCFDGDDADRVRNLWKG
ncbi:MULTISPECIES: hypothetical protein [unclassified Mesorhizobium]|uniref:hypothetical protein n=1 Tax=unclassified Mesorhizobium TaxID=325217 RepID=UPI00112820D1|nr:MULTISPECIES: hypothetical protein [unclassified Mesorhizobium]TPJ51653.1 hypothetical protein FJ426_20690 [Mesorhizobium sp. B2-6-4]TPN42331.1 hypothetical protein FJ979_01970 [Mesorhizobium sp. B1-1-6]